MPGSSCHSFRRWDLISNINQRVLGAAVFSAALVATAGVGPAVHAQRSAINDVTVRDDYGDGSFFTVDLEDNYLPNVVLRENGAASFEALKAQAVAARTFAYYKLQGTTFIRNSQSDQVYSLGGIRSNPGGLWDLAVEQTAGEILTFNDILIASFYVAGAIPGSGGPVAAPGDFDPTNTERWVTYPYANDLLGRFNTGSPLGFTGTPTNPNYPNRGAMSQNGADWQSDRGTHYLDILKFYYGGDIQLEQVTPASPGDFGVKTLASFERNDDYFNRPLTYAGQSRNLGGGTQVERSTTHATTLGGTSQQLTIDYDGAADASDGSADGFYIRHLSSVERAERLSSITSGTVTGTAADPIGNVILPTMGSVGFWLLAEPGDVDPLAELEVALAIDDFDGDILGTTTEQSTFRDVVVDGQWHKYEWMLDDALWSSAFGPGVGDGVLASRFTVDSVLFRGLGDATVFLDDVFYDAAAVPEPATLLMAAVGLAVSVRRRRA